jgi:hypothetical protein
MMGIYQALAEGGVTPAQALRRAQLALRNDNRPFMQSAWRAFSYFGDWHLVPFPTPALERKYAGNSVGKAVTTLVLIEDWPCPPLSTISPAPESHDTHTGSASVAKCGSPKPVTFTKVN